MPEIGRFFGIVITMFYNDHNPPHFHARYGHQRGLVAIDTLRQLDGTLSSRAMALIAEWARKHPDELHANWNAARNQYPLKPIDPLE